MKNLAHNPFLRIAHKSLACILAFCMVNLPVWALNAGDAAVSAGNASITGAANTVSVDLISNRAVLDWTQMNATNAETLNFNGTSGFAVLNRVASAVDFNGALNGIGGHVFVVSPHGVVIGPDASITASSFTASGLNITNTDFMNSVYRFSGNGVGEVANYGHISAQQVALIGKKVLNAGTISSPGGYTILAAGDSVYLNPAGSDVMVEVSGVTVPGGSEGQGIGDVVNEGTINAIDGQIIMAAGDTFSRAIEGIDGMSVAVESGAGRVGQFGTLNANGSESNGGSITLAAADTVVLGENSVTTANAGVSGDGGSVVVYSPDAALFQRGSLVEAKGGTETGDGGFFELSGKEYVDIAGQIDMTATNGKDGHFLIDPRNIKVVASGTEEGNFNDPTDIWKPSDDDRGDDEYSRLPISQLEYYLSNSNVILETDYSSKKDSQTGWVWFDAGRDVQNSTDNSLTVNAMNWIKLDSGINFTGTGDITLNADNDLTVNSAIATGGNLNLYADVSGNVVGDMHSADGVMLYAGGDIDIKGNDIVLGGEVDAGGDLTITGRDCQPGDDDYEWGNVWAKKTLDAGGDIKISDTGEESTWVDGYWEGGTWIPGHWEGSGCHKYWVDGHWEGRTWVDGYYEYSYEPGTIRLDGDVTAGGNIQLYNDTYTTNVTGNGVTLNAGNNIELKNSSDPYENASFLQGQHHLGLIAGNMIVAPETVISVTGSTLLMQQGPTLNTADYLFANQGNTDLTLISNAGSVISNSGDNAANKWKSIGADAAENITLAQNGSSNKTGNDNFKQTIHLGDSGTAGKSLLAGGNIDIDGFSVKTAGNVAPGDGSVEAGGNVDMYVIHEMKIDGDVKSDEGGYISLFADHDYRFGSHVWVTGKIDSGSTLDVEGMNVFLDGGAVSEGDMTLIAHGLYGVANSPDEYLQYGGDVRVGDTLESTNGKVEITAIQATGNPNEDLSGSSYNYLDTTEGPYNDMSVVDYADEYDGSIYTKDVKAKTSVAMTAGSDIVVDGDINTTLDGVNGSVTLLANRTETEAVSDVTTKSITTDGKVTIEGEGLDTVGNIMAGSVDIKVIDDMVVGGVTNYAAVTGNIEADDDINIDSQDHVKVDGSITSDNSSVTVLANTDELTAGGIEIDGQVTTTDNDMNGDGDITLKVMPNGGSFTPGQNATGNIVIGDDIDSANKLTIESQQGYILLKGNVTAENDISLQARGDNKNDPAAYDIRVLGDMETKAGSDADITVKVIDDDIDPAANYPDRWDDVKFDGTVTSDGKLTVETGDDIFALKTLTSKGDMELLAGDDIHLDGTDISAQSLEGKLTITSNLDNPPSEGPEAKVDAAGDLLAKGDIFINASENDIFAAGNIVSSEGDVDIKTGANMDGYGLQVIEATEGTVTADGFIDKIYCGELHITGGDEELAVDIAGDVQANDNIYIKGLGDIQLSGDVTAGEDCIFCELENNDDIVLVRAQIYEEPQGDGECCGGVSIISEDGKVYTTDADGLSVTIRGYSNDAEGQGVNLSGDPFNDGELGKAAIIIISKDDLVLDSGAVLEAYGFYDTTGAVDDRPGMTLLEEDADIPFIDEYPRDPGEAFDVAIYLKSTGTDTEAGQGNVFVDAAVSIQSFDGEVCGNEGGMVVDAYDTVTFGDNFVGSLEGGTIGDRLEVVSRITEWLEDAVGRLPFPGEFDLPDGYNYVMRGAGLENPDIEDGRAWVLENQASDIPAAPLPLLEIPQLKGCPAVMDAAATELAVNSDELQLLIANSMATNPNLQPCTACENLLKAASALKGINPETMAAMNQIFNNLAPSDAPFTPEASASIQTAFADFREMDAQLAAMTDEQYQEYQQYAMTDKLIEAFVAYVAVLDNDLKLPVGNAMALVMEKYFGPIEESGNPNIAAYLVEQMQVAQIATE